MPLRLVDDDFCNDPFIAQLDTDGYALYSYCICNPQQRASGIWSARTPVIAEHTHIKVERVEELLRAFEVQGKIKWYPLYNIIWTKNFARRQINAPKVLISVLNQLMKVPVEIAKDFLEYYPQADIWEKYDVDITELLSRFNNNKPNGVKPIIKVRKTIQPIIVGEGGCDE